MGTGRHSQNRAKNIKKKKKKRARRAFLTLLFIVLIIFGVIAGFVKDKLNKIDYVSIPLEDINMNLYLRKIIELNIFEIIIFLDKSNKGRIKDIYHLDKLEKDSSKKYKQ